MSEKRDPPNPPVDPLKAWREWFVKSEREWSESLSRLMTEDTAARAIGQEINAVVHAQQMMKQGLAGSLASMNLPTQDQLVTLGERVGALEDAVARVESMVVQIRHAMGGAATAAPRRSRKAPAVAPSQTEPTGTRPASASKRRRP